MKDLVACVSFDLCPGTCRDAVDACAGVVDDNCYLRQRAERGVLQDIRADRYRLLIYHSVSPGLLYHTGLLSRD